MINSCRLLKVHKHRIIACVHALSYGIIDVMAIQLTTLLCVTFSLVQPCCQYTCQVVLHCTLGALIMRHSKYFYFCKVTQEQTQKYIYGAYRSFMKESPPLFLAQFPVYRVKVYSNECPPWSELCVTNRVHLWSFGSTASSTSGYASPKVTRRQL